MCASMGRRRVLRARSTCRERTRGLLKQMMELMRNDRCSRIDRKYLTPRAVREVFSLAVFPVCCTSIPVSYFCLYWGDTSMFLSFRLIQLHVASGVYH